MGRGGSGPDTSRSRRRFLRRVGAGTASTLVALSGCGRPDAGPRPPATETETPAPDTATPTATTAEPEPSPLLDVRGAVYFPSRTFNQYQAWEQYDPEETVRDLSYARSVNLNALRTLVSYEYWRDSPEESRRKLDHLFAAAAERGIRVLPVLFESIGEEPTSENLHDRDVLRNGAIRSPSHEVIRNESEWTGPHQFVRWFVGRYGDHDGLLAVEVMNEPGEWDDRVRFCRAMLQAARGADPDAPLTMGSVGLSNNLQYDDPPLDVFQFHYNLPPTTAHMEAALAEASRLSRETETPVWLTEWQRTRQEPPDVLVPNYSSLAATVRDGDVAGDFFWQLMLKPAYGYVQRAKGRLNGLFYEDGWVYSADDARAVAGEDGEWNSRQTWPEWARELRRSDE
ncbi:cellulase family glycosylhydrolase [Halogeometricum luteum]|uniref:Cellulase family glycosylhydrolase n=1 Tax=Halogeometricum luteum TaxID=2950537 RepID=A0ABU2FZX7_9EURY|nr:cellulase family glycosylhydrolase [Halogeometricum sp. S3BR5-2]MDS0294082.1 cellulase family glycosylhydrolase [Halogeometricum sp. S3BR5-2]